MVSFETIEIKMGIRKHALYKMWLDVFTSLVAERFSYFVPANINEAEFHF